MLSVVGDGAFLPFRASLFMTTVMDNCLVAQNTCLHMGAVGRNPFIGAGMIIYPARTIESDEVLFASKERRVVDKDATHEQSDYHRLAWRHLHRRLYPRPGQASAETWGAKTLPVRKGRSPSPVPEVRPRQCSRRADSRWRHGARTRA